MDLIRSSKFRLYPNSVQKSLLHNLFSLDRFVYNALLGSVNDAVFGKTTLKDNRIVNTIPSKIDLIKHVTTLKGKHPFLYQIGNDFLQGSATNLATGFNKFYSGGGFPEFKKKHKSKQSINMYAGSRAKIDEKYVYLPVPSERNFDKSSYKIAYNKHKIKWNIDSITGYSISKDSVGDYWLSVTFKTSINYRVSSQRECGLDMGLTHIAITSDGEKFENDRITKKHQEKITKLSRRLSKKQKGSNNRKKVKLRLAKAHRKIKNVRNHRNHCLSRDLVNVYDYIAVETLKVKSMMANRKLAKAIADVSWFDIISKLDYKLTENQGKLVKINQWFPSSKACSCCGNIKSDLQLSDRLYKCAACGSVFDRDVNAAVNILNESKKSY